MGKKMNIREQAKMIVAQLKKQGCIIVPVESCTGGGMANAISNVVGASDVMGDAFVTYCTEAKVKLGVPTEMINRYSVYSGNVAVEMARAGLLKSVKANIAVGITGSISRIDNVNPNSEPGVVYIAVAQKNLAIVDEFKFNESNRAKAKALIIKKAFEMVHKVLDEKFL